MLVVRSPFPIPPELQFLQNQKYHLDSIHKIPMALIENWQIELAQRHIATLTGLDVETQPHLFLHCSINSTEWT